MQSIRENLLRSFLTLFIIALGIGCLVGITTAIDSFLNSLNENFSEIGANSFQIEKTSRQGRRKGRTYKVGPSITSQQAKEFKKRYNFQGSKVSTTISPKMAIAEYRGKKTAPILPIIGIDENYLSITNKNIVAGRAFSSVEINNNNNIAIIGSDIVKTLFNEKTELALGKKILIDGLSYKVIGVLESKGSSFGNSEGNTILIPLTNAKINFGYSNMHHTTTVYVNNTELMDSAISSAIGTMRNIRKLRADQKNNFKISKSDGLMEILKEQTVQIRIATYIIAALTILGAAIGLMNIMLVSVTERTKEIGVRKALGATNTNILIQFLTEAVVICLLGGIVGIVLGTSIGYAVSIVMKGTYAIPWTWMIIGFIVCIITGITAGLIPALKAASLDPVESLRKG